MSVDNCLTPGELTCSAQKRWRKSAMLEKHIWKVPWQISLPLQLGGLAHKSFDSIVTSSSLQGCISKLKINSKVRETEFTGSCEIVLINPVK